MNKSELYILIKLINHKHKGNLHVEEFLKIVKDTFDCECTEQDVIDCLYFQEEDYELEDRKQEYGIKY